jgi:hypothetical protein
LAWENGENFADSLTLYSAALYVGRTPRLVEKNLETLHRCGDSQRLGPLQAL